jgi:hypothetical protein
MPKGEPGYMAYIDPDRIEYDALVNELNELDGVSSYYRERAKNSVTMVYGAKRSIFPREITLERPEAEEKLNFLRQIRGLPPKGEQTC